MDETAGNGNRMIGRRAAYENEERDDAEERSE
jgi:hypothetical protein